MHKHCRSLLLATLALSCGLLASCLSSGPEKPLGAMADAMEKNDSATFLAQMDMPLFAANEARNMTNENEALNMLDSLGQDLGLGGTFAFNRDDVDGHANFYGSDGINQISLKTTYKLRIKKFEMPVFAHAMWNPDLRKGYLQVGINLFAF